MSASDDRIPVELHEADEQLRARGAALRENAARRDRLGSGDVQLDLVRLAVKRGVDPSEADAARTRVVESVDVREARQREQRSIARAKAEADRRDLAFNALKISITSRVREALFAGTLDDELQRIAPDDPLARHALTSVETWLDQSEVQVLVVLGDMGRGKTVASAVAAFDAIKRRRSVARFAESELVTYAHSPTITHGDRFDVACNVELLIVEELGMSLATPDRVRAALFRALDARIPNGLRTLLISNHGADTAEKKHVGDRQAIEAFGAAYGGRFLDRMREIGSFCVVKGPSLRGRS